MARDLLSVQASTVALESAFSTCGWVLSIRRTRLTRASLEMWICLKDHLDAAECIQHISSLEDGLEYEEQLHDIEVETSNAFSDEETALDEATSKVSWVAVYEVDEASTCEKTIIRLTFFSSSSMNNCLIGSIELYNIYSPDHAIYGQSRDSVSIQPVALRQKKEKISSRVPKNALGNHWAIAASESGTTKLAKEFHDLTYLLADSFMKTVKEYSKVGHDSNERKEMILNSFADIANVPDTSVVWLASWCKFPFNDVDFGFGKPIWVSCGFVPFKRGMMLLDDALGDGVKVYVTILKVFVDFSSF
nr:pelargonidin 3-O-(6-caffeoylglucoside) 5-O-(6-O-malonylglucoside) 4'''-malonyltransferase-like [Tanacetum cinerariifolium]